MTMVSSTEPKMPLPAVAVPSPLGAAPDASALAVEDLAVLTRPDFPLLDQIACLGEPLVYLDFAATRQKPRQVLTALSHYYGHDNANVHRGAHQLSVRATEAFEGARESFARFIGATTPREIVYTRNASEAINLVARSWGDAFLREGDEVLLTLMEHHSNLVPWQLLAQRTGCVLRHAGVTESGELDLDDWISKLNERTRLVSVVHVSNTLGALNPVARLAELAHSAGALILVDACQSLPHQSLSVAQLDCDFLVGSSHKLCGPTGMGFLWAREALLESMPPFLGGGGPWRERPRGNGTRGWNHPLRHWHAIGPLPEPLLGPSTWRPLRWRGYMPTTLPPCWIRLGSAFAVVITAPSLCIDITVYLARPGPVWPSPQRRRKSTTSLMS